MSWTEALRTIVKDCYKHHGREDLLHVFSDEGSQPQVQQATPFAGTMLQVATFYLHKIALRKTYANVNEPICSFFLYNKRFELTYI